MRSKFRRLYDSLYYKFELNTDMLANNIRSCIMTRNIKTDKAFQEAFRESIRPYWAQFGIRAKRHWYKYLYSLTGSTDPRYIPHPLWAGRIIPYFDNPLYIRQLADKNLHSLLFHSMKRPETIFKCLNGRYCEDDFSPITREIAFSRLRQEGSYVIKPTRDSGQGSDIRFFHALDTCEEIEAFLAPYNCTDYIVQKAVVQHPILAQFNASSLNTIRIVTVVFQGQAHILSSILRIGAAGSKVDNVSKGGYQCTIQPDGTLDRLAWTNRSGQGVMVEENENGLRFDSVVIPGFEKIRETALKLAYGLPHLRLIGWDLALDETGEIVLIEFNSQISQNQATCGPTFGDMTDDILREVFCK